MLLTNTSGVDSNVVFLLSLDVAEPIRKEEKQEEFRFLLSLPSIALRSRSFDVMVMKRIEEKDVKSRVKVGRENERSVDDDDDEIISFRTNRIGKCALVQRIMSLSIDIDKRPIKEQVIEEECRKELLRTRALLKGIVDNSVDLS